MYLLFEILIGIGYCAVSVWLMSLAVFSHFSDLAPNFGVSLTELPLHIALICASTSRDDLLYARGF